MTSGDLPFSGTLWGQVVWPVNKMPEHDRGANRQIGRQTDRQTDGQTDRQVDR